MLASECRGGRTTVNAQRHRPPEHPLGRGEESVALRSRSRPLKQVVVAARHRPDEWLIWM